MQTRREILDAAFGFGSLLGAQGVVSMKQEKRDNGKDELEELKISFSKLKQDYVSLQQEVSSISNELLGALPAVGTIAAYAGSINKDSLPKGWRLCNGDSLEIASFSSLYKAIGSAWGSPSATAFNLPDL